MNLKKSNFCVYSCLYKDKNGTLRNRKIFSYESSRCLYDVVINEDKSYFFRNDLAVSEKKPHHVAIIRHFGLVLDE